MKSNTFLYLVLLIATTLLSCQSKQPSTPPTTDAGTQRESTTKHLPLINEFHSVTNIGSMNIELSEGPCALQATGDAALISHIQYDVDGGILTVSLPMERMTSTNQFATTADITLHISCPEFHMLANIGTGNVRSIGTLRTTDLHMGGMGSGTLAFDSIVCQTFRYEGQANSTAQFAHVACDEATVIQNSDSKVEADVAAAVHATLDLTANAQCTAQLTTARADVILTESAVLNLHADIDDLMLEAYNSSNATLTGNTRRSHIQQKQQAVVQNRLER